VIDQFAGTIDTIEDGQYATSVVINRLDVNEQLEVRIWRRDARAQALRELKPGMVVRFSGILKSKQNKKNPRMRFTNYEAEKWEIRPASTDTPAPGAPLDDSNIPF
jgi:hypothetical protein